MELVFLGVNDIGFCIYEWLCDREDATVQALLTERTQLELVEKLKPDLILSVGFDHLVPSEILAIPKYGALNLHPALLPYNRGKSPNVWPLIDGTPAGVTLHYMDDKFDTGPVVAQREVKTDFADTGKDLHQRLEEAQFELFTDSWSDIVSDKIEATPQNNNKGTYYTTDNFIQACELDPDESVCVENFLNRLRALTFPPFDNATIEIDDQQYYVDVDIRRADEELSNESAGLISSY